MEKGQESYRKEILAFMLIKKLPLRITFALIIGSFFICGNVNADVSMYYQTIDTANTGFITNTGSTNVTYQQLGTGLTGVVNEVSFKLDFGVLPATPLGVEIVQCDNNGNPLNTCTNAVTIFNDDITISSTSTTQYFSENDSGYTGQLDPSKYYFLVIFANGGTLNTRYYGSPTSEYTGGDCIRYNAGVANACTNVADLFFVLNGVQTTSDTSYTWLLQPGNASTTASTQVSTSFRYHAVAANSITSYAMVFYDITQDESFTITGAASTGDATISRILTLTSGHAYSYNAYICNDSSTCYGGGTVFFSVVSSTYSIGTTQTNSPISTSTGLLTPTGVGSELPLPTIITDANATSSVSQGIQSFGNIPALLSNKYPFNWIYDIANAFNNAGTTTSSDSFVDWSIDYSSFNSTLASSTMAKGILPSRFTLLSTTTYSTYISDSNRELFKNIMKMAMYVGLAIQVYYMAVSGKFLPSTA